MAVPNGGVARGNGAIWKAFQSPHLEHCELFFDEVIKNNLTRSDPACAPESGGTGETPACIRAWRYKAQSLEVHEALIYRLPPQGHCSPNQGAGQEIEAGPCGKRCKGEHPPEKCRVETPPL